MSAAKKPSQVSKGKKDPFLEKFEIESDFRLFRFMGIFVLLGAAFVSYLMTVHSIIPGVLQAHSKKEITERKVEVKLEVKKEEEKKKEKEKEKKPPQSHEGAAAKARGRGNPHAVATQAALKLITSKSASNALSGYTLLASKFTKDIDKVLNGVSGLTKTGQTRVGGRKGMAGTGGFNEGFASGTSGGVDDLLGGLWGGGGGGVNLTAKGGAGLQAPKASEIELGSEGGQRSTESIISVIRQHTPGLRHTFEKYLKLQPGFKGKVSFHFIIAPSGAIIELTIVSSTTGSDAFDQEIREKVKTWRFEPIKGKGNDAVNVPFNFSE